MSNNNKSRNAWSKPLAAPPGLSKQSSNKPPQSTSNNNHKQTNPIRERFLHLQLSLIGQNVVLQLIDGSTVQGVLHTFTPFDHPSLPLEHRNRYVIKAARVSKGKGDEEKEIDTDGSNSGSGKTIIVEAEKVSQLIVKSIRLEQNSNPQARRSQMAMVPQMDTQM